jgi:hypothetical protein
LWDCPGLDPLLLGSVDFPKIYRQGYIMRA